MTISAENLAVQDVYFDPYDVDINANPYPAFAQLREKAPLYYNKQYDFYALSRFADVNTALVDASLSPTSTVRGWDSMPAVLK